MCWPTSSQQRSADGEQVGDILGAAGQAGAGVFNAESIGGDLVDLACAGGVKGTRWLLLKHPDNLDPKRNEKQRLQEALKLNQPLATAYYLEEDLRQLWEQEGYAQASGFLNDWIARARCSGAAR
ncbi:MAG: transposase [Tepidisphaeraceae bacterium]|jgi:hypothetical protein